MTAAAFANSPKREADVAIVVGVRDAVGLESSPSTERATGSRQVSVVATAFDDDWKARAAFTQTLDVGVRLGSASAGEYELASRLALPPGRYEIRFAAESDGRTGSVFTDIEIPNFAKDELSVSGLVLARTPPVAMASADALSGFLPVVPTSARDFAATDKVTGFLRMYESGKQPVGTVSVRAWITDEADRVSWQSAATIVSGRFTPAHAADYQVDLPLGRLRAGAYLFSLEAKKGARTVRRDARFTITSRLRPLAAVQQPREQRHRQAAREDVIFDRWAFAAAGRASGDRPFP